MSDEFEFRKVFLALGIGRIDEANGRLMSSHTTGDSSIEARTLVKVRLTVTAQNHVRRCKSVHTRILFNSDELMLLDVLDFCLSSGRTDHLIHGRDKEPAGTSAGIENGRVLIDVGKKAEELSNMLGSEDDSKPLAIATGILEKLTVEGTNDIEVVVDGHERHDLLSQHGDNFIEKTLRIGFRRLGKFRVNLNSREGLSHVRNLGVGNLRTLNHILD